MTNKLQILPLKTIESRSVKTIPYPLQQPNFLMIIVGPCRSGKGVFLMNILLNKNLGYKEYFDKIIYISPTLPSDKTGKILYKDDDIIKMTDDLEHLNEILKIIVEDQKKSEESLLVVIDDCLGLLGSNSGYFSNLCSKYRHYNMSLIVTTQNFRSIPLICRNNASSYVLFKSHNKKEIEKIDEELSNMIPDFMKLYKEATDKKFGFLFIDTEKVTCWDKFDKLMYEK
jgi:hypothetical protein